MSDELRFRHKRATAKLVVWDKERATVSNLFSVQRGKGHAKGVMQKIVDYADDHGLILTLVVGMYGYADKDSMDNAALKVFYAKFGFKDMGRNFMERVPS